MPEARRHLHPAVRVDSPGEGTSLMQIGAIQVHSRGRS